MDLAFDPELDFKLLLAVPLIPLIGYVIQIFFGKHLPRKGDWLLTGGMFVVMCITVWMFAKALWGSAEHGHFSHNSSEVGMTYGWFFNQFQGESSANVVAGILYDGLGAAMLAVVGVVSFCVHLFSIGYMHGDKRYHIFFANISLFTFAMLGLVLSDNVLFLFIFWEIMGLMSYLLIGHFAHDPKSGWFFPWATWASKKAFLTTRIGDVLLFVGIMIFWSEFHTLQFTELWSAMEHRVAEHGYEGWMFWAGLFTFGGTVGKSAQFPLHIWLPDAMAGPTPVSAMIHAATMVAAGVFLMGRMYPMFTPEVLQVAAVVGAITALMAATIGTTAYDIKAVLAYSTISQLGFMVAAVGVGGVMAGMWHMVTHAFFKACLFLSAGSVIHGCHHEQDMRKMGGLRKMMPVTFACMFICTLAISGVPYLFSGFYSKDQIVADAFYAGFFSDHPTMAGKFVSIALPLAASLTAFYMFRMIFLTFFGENRAIVVDGHGDGHGHDDHGHDDHGHGHHTPHESPKVMLIPLIVLSILAIFGGKFWLFGFGDGGDYFKTLANVDHGLYGDEIGHFVAGDHDEHAEHAHHVAHNVAAGVSIGVAGLGILIAWLFYIRRRDLPEKFTRGIGGLYTLVREKYFVDEFADRTVIGGSVLLAKLLRFVDEKVVDGLVLLVGRINRAWGFVSAWFDRVFVDGLVNWVGLASQSFGAAVRLLQTGRVQQYASFAVAGGMLVAAWMILV